MTSQTMTSTATDNSTGKTFFLAGIVEESRRWRRHPLLAMEVLCCTLLISLLHLAFPIFSIQVFNRYLAHGHDGTLLALTGGAVLALIFLHGLSLLRGQMITALNHEPQRETVARAMEALTRLRISSLHGKPLQDETADALARLESCHSLVNVAAICDFPFALVYLCGVFFLHPLLGVVCVFCIIGVLAAGLHGALRGFRDIGDLRPQEQTQRRLLYESTAAAETLRLFEGRAFLLRRWKKTPTASWKDAAAWIRDANTTEPSSFPSPCC